MRDHLRHLEAYQFKWCLNYVIQLEALYKGQKEKLDATFAAIVAEREELEANVAAKELASKRSDADAEELIKVGCDHHKVFRVSLPVSADLYFQYLGGFQWTISLHVEPFHMHTLTVKINMLYTNNVHIRLSEQQYFCETDGYVLFQMQENVI